MVYMDLRYNKLILMIFEPLTLENRIIKSKMIKNSTSVNISPRMLWRSERGNNFQQDSLLTFTEYAIKH